MENFLKMWHEDLEDSLSAAKLLTTCHKTGTCDALAAQIAFGVFGPTTPRMANVQRHMKYQIAWYNMITGRLL